MSNFLDTCQDLFGTKDLYELIGVEKNASLKELKRGYHRVSLQVHPDRVSGEEKDEATLKFQALGKAYTVLSDKDRRAAYDETGDVDDDDGGISQDRDWMEYWRLLYAKVSVNDIKEFEEKYKGSSEEEKDLKEAYVEYKGDMDLILDSVLCATVEDDERFRDILADCIKKKELPKFKGFTKDKDKKQAERKRRANAEAKEAESLADELGINQSDPLKSLILKKNQSREKEMDNFFSHLEAKYAKPKKGKKK